MPNSPLDPLRKRFRRARVAALGMSALLIAGVYLQLWATYHQAMESAEILSQTVTKAITERVGGTIRAVDSLLEETAVARQSNRTETKEFRERMVSRLELFPEVRYIGTVTAQGQLEARTWPQLDIPDAGVGIADREYFQALPKAYGSTGLIFGRPTIGRTTGQRSIHVARPITDRDGYFAGAVIASINPDNFATFLETVLLDPEGGSAVLSTQGDMIARAPDHSGKFGINIADSDLFTKWLRQGPGGMAILVSKADGNDKFVSYRKLDRYPLVVTSGISKNMALGDWRRMAVIEGALLLVAIVAIFYWAHRSDRSTRDISDYGHRLEMAVQNRTRELAKARDTAHQQAQRLEKVNKELQRLAMVTAHHLQEPLRPLVSYSQLLEKRLGPLDAEALGMLNYVRTAAIRLKSLLRDFQRYVATMTESPRVQWVDSRAIADTAMETAIRTTGAADTIITLGGLPLVSADPNLLRQVFLELFINAIRYHPLGVPARIAVRSMTTPQGWTFSVSDDGPGIPPAMREKVLQVFENVLDRPPDSTGLGLPLCRLIIESHGGTIAVKEGEPQGYRGAWIEFFLPIQSDDGGKAVDETPPGHDLPEDVTG